ncbi:unnamed protein product [Rotaria sp. Silwood1]|nr:unnamed protein product [Rotaria sp. Silwood1]CAF3444404.1 unnamed protein product [Rotaria sp. Silwood1]CAF3448837.1 unnamed protein product [Rotaria sp. Silwood1]CAF4566195.1 unnamed protein product [Rotaria sp. Silwood1]CAF4625257.1 unnamed protein product [Rotaria sp. Silwood1]
MLAFFTVFEYLSNVRRLLNRFHTFYSSSTSSTETSLPPSTTTTKRFDEQVSIDRISTSNEQQHDILLGPVVNNILSDNRLNYFDKKFREDLQNEDYFARELDACLLEMRDIERDLLNLKQRQCYFYEQYLDFIDKKNELIDQFIEYYDEYILDNSDQSSSSTSKHLRRQSIKYEFNIPVSNRFDLLKS